MFKKVQAGFTLIELVLVIALLIISVGISSDIIVSLVRSYNKTQIADEIEQSANFVMLRVENDLRNATQVTTPNTVGNSSDTLIFVDSVGDTVTYALNGSVLTRAVNGGPTLNLTDDSITGGGVEVACPSGTDCFTLWNASPQVVQVRLEFSHVGSASSFFTGNVTLDNTIVVRGTY